MAGPAMAALSAPETGVTGANGDQLVKQYKI
jgi:hypothetical protein